MTETPTRDEKGRFLPGNPLWQLHAFAEGNPGRPNKWTPAECAEIVTVFIESRINDGKPLTKAGLLLALGIDWPTYYRYETGEFGKSEEDIRAYSAIFKTYNTLMEDEQEGKLCRDKGQVSGVIFRLTNQFGDRWRSEKHISIENNEVRTIKLVLPEDSALRKRLTETDGGELIEGQQA